MGLGTLVQKLFRKNSLDREQALAKFNARYQSFKNLLQANADMAKILATLDTVYHGGKNLNPDDIRHEVMRAVVSVRAMYESLDSLSGGRYKELQDAIDAIAGRISGELHAYTPGDVSELTLSLAEVDASMAYSVGAKNANLGEIRNMVEMPVPRGFAITIRAGQLFLNHNRGLFTLVQKSLAKVDIDHPQTIQVASGEIAEAILGTPVPAELEEALLLAYDRHFGETRCPVALRSSAIAEDGVQSFAGQYLSILGVTRETLPMAFKRVLASLYSPRALTYRLTNGYELSTFGMAMCCLQMIRARAAGVAYSRHPVNMRSNDVLVNGVWGLGEAVADGSALPDQWLVSRATLKITRETIVGKLTRVALDQNPDGTVAPHVHEVEELLRHVPCLTPELVENIARAAIRLEHHYQYPQDIEWALDEDETLYFLQTRPMGFDTTTSEDVRAPELERLRPIVSHAEVAARGVACGRVTIMDPDEDMTHFPEGHVLVLTHSSSNATVAMQRACAIVAEVGSLTGHMASVCREYGVPTLINAPGATMLLEDNQLVTVDALKGRVFDGEIPELLELHIPRPPAVNTPATALMRHMAPHILPLHLIDPRAASFTPANCTSLHDVMRFIHEKSYSEMFLLSDSVTEGKEKAATRFTGSIPLDLYIIDLGGGLKDPLKPTARLGDVTCYPLRVLLEGMLNPTVRAHGPRPVNLHGFMSVMGNTMLNGNTAERFGDHSYAIVSDRYFNFSSRVGYHYAIVDCWCSSTVSKNYIRFEFAGGAAGSIQRQRRVRCIGIILKELGFKVSVIADRVQARYQKYPRTELSQRLDQLGRLLIMTRQMDMLMTSEDAVTLFATNFLNGDYH